MPIEVPEELLTASSGAVGDLVFSHNQHGPYTRARTAPIDPATAAQLAVRAALAQCVTAWNATLTGPERRGWDAFALAVRTRTALGRSTNPGGLAAFVRANVPRIQAAVGGSPRVDQAPALFTSAPFTPVTRVVLNVVDDTFHPFFAESDPWSTESGAAMMFATSPPQPLTRNFWAGPYRFAGSLLGSNPFLSSPGTIPLAFPAVASERVFVRGRLTLADARISSAFRLTADTVPQVAPLFTGAVFAVLTPPNFQLTVSFDALIRQQLLAAGNWLWRFQNRLFNPFSAVVDGDTVVLTSLEGPPNVGLDIVRYLPAPRDVFGLLTGIPVATFVLPF